MLFFLKIVLHLLTSLHSHVCPRTSLSISTKTLLEFLLQLGCNKTY